uniref:uncharacterized protein LOC131105640 isoform X3 n=1 Tax=Doryrhamphus excisus TaxID=161450 RepID=UPI0025ADA3AC|nr:uncharacterized protein LOC131105640 isoform X3 [Doryrhamphus excisus]
MSLTMTRTNEVTVLTLTSDSKSRWPPLCQIFCSLCYSPFCCSVSQHLRTVMGASQSVLGALHIMVGLLHIGLGTILLCSGPGSWWQMDESAFPEWLGGLIIVNVILNFSGIAFAIAAIVLYSLNLANTSLWSICERYDDNDYYWRRRKTPSPTMSPSEEYMQQKCLEGKGLILVLLRSINGVLIVLSVLELCLVISSSVLAIKALTCSSSSSNRDEKSLDDAEKYTPLLEENNPSA